MQLGYPGLGDVQEGPDFLHGQFVEVIELDHELLFLGQHLHGVPEDLLDLRGLEGLAGVLGIRIRHEADEAFAFAVLAHLDEGAQGHALQIIQVLVQFFEGDPQVDGHLLVRGRPSLLLLEGVVGTFDVLLLAAQAAGHPVQFPEAVEDGALDPELGVGLELDVARGFELLDGIHEAEDAAVDEVVQLHMRGQAGGDAVRHELHQGHVILDDLFAIIAIEGLRWLHGFPRRNRRGRAGRQVGRKG